jgi:hypothetical protein
MRSRGERSTRADYYLFTLESADGCDYKPSRDLQAATTMGNRFIAWLVIGSLVSDYSALAAEGHAFAHLAPATEARTTLSKQATDLAAQCASAVIPSHLISVGWLNPPQQSFGNLSALFALYLLGPLIAGCLAVLFSRQAVRLAVVPPCMLFFIFFVWRQPNGKMNRPLACRPRDGGADVIVQPSDL